MLLEPPHYKTTDGKSALSPDFNCDLKMY